MGGGDPGDYYARRAPEYDDIYRKPERQEDLASLREFLPILLAGREVLELACGTGYWTEVIAASVRSVLAVDLASEVLERARRRALPAETVRFLEGDAYRPEELPGDFDAALAAFFWSHVPRRRLAGFLDSLHRRLEPGARVVFLDNLFVEGSSTPVSGENEDGDTFQERVLADGSRYRVLKNFPDEEELRAAVGETAASVEIRLLKHFWLLRYDLHPRR